MSEPRLSDGSVAKVGMRVRCSSLSNLDWLVTPLKLGAEYTVSDVLGEMLGVEGVDDGEVHWFSFRFTPAGEQTVATTKVTVQEAGSVLLLSNLNSGQWFRAFGLLRLKVGDRLVYRTEVGDVFLVETDYRVEPVSEVSITYSLGTNQ